MLPCSADQHLMLNSPPALFRQDFAPFKEDSGARNGVEEKNEFQMKRRIMRRDIERQRRQQMAALYTCLRSLLPLQYIRGKRSMSDHMQETMDYIKNTERKIQELRELRERMIDNGCGRRSACPDRASFHVSLSSFGGRSGVVVLVSCKDEEGIPLSRILIELINSNLTVICCVSARASDRLLYTIHSEVDGHVHVGVLQQRMVKAINEAALQNQTGYWINT